MIYLFLAEAGFVQISLQGRTRQLTRFDSFLSFKDVDDLVDRPGRHLPLQLNGLIQHFIKTGKRSPDLVCNPSHRLQSFKLSFLVSSLIPAQGAF